MATQTNLSTPSVLPPPLFPGLTPTPLPPAPLLPTPVGPAPVQQPTPGGSTIVGPNPVAPTPVAPAPVAPAPVAPAPVAPAPTPGGDAFTVPPTTPTFEELRKRLAEPIKIAPLPTLGSAGTAGQSTFDRGIQSLQSTAIRPEIQNALDVLRSQSEKAKTAGASQAQALARRRGVQGSSIEQFGTAEAIRGVEEASQTAQANTLLQNIQANQVEASAFLDRASRIDQITSNQEIANLQAEANRGNQQAQFDLQQKLTEAGLTMDEINTQKNIDLQLQQLEVERILGERGLALTEENIRLAQDQARRASRDQLVGNLTSVFGPQVLKGIIGGGGGGIFNPGQATGGLASLFGGGALGGASATGQAALSSFVPASAAGTPGAAGLFGGGAGATLGIGAGILGGVAGRKVFGGNQSGDAAGSFIGSGIGTGIGFAFGGPLGAAAGSFIGAGVGKLGSRTVGGIGKIFKGETPKTIKNIGNEISKGVKKIFPF